MATAEEHNWLGIEREARKALEDGSLEALRGFVEWARDDARHNLAILGGGTLKEGYDFYGWDMPEGAEEW